MEATELHSPGRHADSWPRPPSVRAQMILQFVVGEVFEVGTVCSGLLARASLSSFSSLAPSFPAETGMVPVAAVVETLPTVSES